MALWTNAITKGTSEIESNNRMSTRKLGTVSGLESNRDLNTELVIIGYLDQVFVKSNDEQESLPLYRKDVSFDITWDF